MKKTVVAFLFIALMVVGFCGCDKSDSEEQAITNVEESTNTIFSTDEVTVNELRFSSQECDENEVFNELLINFTSGFDFDCSTIGIEANLVDENNNIIENTYATLDNVHSGQSGDASVTLDGDTDLNKIKTIEICSYCAWKQSNNDAIEGVFSQKQTFDIKDISINIITD